MPNRRKTVNQIKETLRLKECKLSVRQISKVVNISRPKVSDPLDKDLADFYQVKPIRVQSWGRF